MLCLSHNDIILVSKMFFCHIFAQVVSFIWKFFSPQYIPLFLSPPTLSTSKMKCYFLRAYFSNLTDLISSLYGSPLNSNPYPIYPWNSSLNVTNSAIFTLVYLTVNTPSLCSHSILCLFSYYFNSLYLTICVNILFFYSWICHLREGMCWIYFAHLIPSA